MWAAADPSAQLAGAVLGIQMVASGPPLKTAYQPVPFGTSMIDPDWVPTQVLALRFCVMQYWASVWVSAMASEALPSAAATTASEAKSDRWFMTVGYPSFKRTRTRGGQLDGGDSQSLPRRARQARTG